MGALTQKRSNKIVEEQESINRQMASATSSVNRELGRVTVFAAWAYDQLLQGTGDIEPTDLAIIQAEYQEQAAKIRAFVTLLDDIEGVAVENPDGTLNLTATQAALDDFVTRHGLNLSQYDSRF